MGKLPLSHFTSESGTRLSKLSCGLWSPTCIPGLPFSFTFSFFFPILFVSHRFKTLLMNVKYCYILDVKIWLRGTGSAQRSYPVSKVRISGCALLEKLWRAIRETHVRGYVLREGIRRKTDWNHSHRQLANLITWTTALFNSIKPSHAV